VRGPQEALWKITKEGTEAAARHRRFGMVYKLRDPLIL
jgi:hypothetical protein